MIYYSKSLGDKQERQRKQSLAAYTAEFALTGSVLPTNAVALRRWSRAKKSNARALADLVAGVLRNLYEEEYFKRDSIDRVLLRLSRDLLSHQGYVEKHKSELISLGGADANLNLVLVAGCQNEEILDSRVRAALEVCVELLHGRRLVQIVFSGSCPGEEAKIPDESRRMRSKFDELLKRVSKKLDIDKIMFVSLAKEGMATKTLENVRYFMEQKGEELETPCNVYIVSSTFHVSRICREFEEQLQRAVEAGLKNECRNIVAIGSEPIEGNNITSLNSYFKSMCFECLQEVFAKDQFWPTAKKKRKRSEAKPPSSPELMVR